jgi:hypothetical protein
MKRSALFLTIFLLSLTVSAYNPETNSQVTNAPKMLAERAPEIQQNFESVFDDEVFLFTSESKKTKVIIMDQNLNIIREECVDEMQNLCNQSTLVPIIYRSEFVAKVNKVSYFILTGK